MKYIIAILVPAAIAFIVCSILKGTMKTANKQFNADKYVGEEGLTLMAKTDVFVRTEEVRTPINTNPPAQQGGPRPGAPKPPQGPQRPPQAR